MPQPLGPAPIIVDGRRVVCPDVEKVQATLRLDVTAQEAVGEASVVFLTGDQAGHPALDLRQPIEWARLDGQHLDPGDVAPLDLGAGPGTEMRVLDVALEGATRHELAVGYRLDTPQANGAQPIGWTSGGTNFDFWMSDLEPGRYLEMWVPAPLIHDRFGLEVTVEVTGQDRSHTLIANAPDIETEADKGRWTVRYPDRYTALSPMLVLRPSEQIEIRRGAVTLPDRERPIALVTARSADVDADLAACEADIRSWLVYLASRYGPWVHGDAFWAMLWEPGRGMEYDGATTASVPALEHEVFHSWFGRGVKPARAGDGWIDEAFTSWATASRRVEQPRFAAEELILDEPPVELYPQHPWARHTPLASYAAGSRLFSGLAYCFGGAERLRSAMADWYRANAGGLITTNGLAAHLREWSGIDISPLWARYVHGRE